MWCWKIKGAMLILVLAVLALIFPLSQPVAAASIIDPSVWEWQNPLPQGNALNGVWGSSSSDVFAVGDDGTILHYNFTAWSSMSSGTTHRLYGVWGSSSSDVFAVGDGGTILHYNGASWSSMSSGTTYHLNGVWGSSSSDVFAVGAFDTILHYNGASWNSMSSSTSDRLYGVWGSSSSDVFAVGAFGTILHYNGTSWSSMSSDTTYHLYGVWGSSSSDVFAVGDYGTILHYNGASWNSMSSGATYDPIWGVWGSSSSDVVAVGAFLGLLHYNGTAWRQITSGPGCVWYVDLLYDVWGSSSSDVFAVGAFGMILHWDGACMDGFPDTGTTNHLYGVWGSSSSDVFAVGDGGTILHYNGDSWSSMASGTTHRLYDVWSSSSSDVFAVGDGGIILHYNGTAWSSMSSGTTYHLHDVWGGSASDVFAVGDYGTILHYNGDSWSSVGSGTTYHLNGVCRSSAFDVFVIGDCGTILHATRPAPAQAGTYSFSIDVGSMHFAGEKAEFYVLSTYNGTPADATIALVNLYGPGGTLTADLTGAVTSVTTGLFRIPYDIPAAAPTGTYTLLIETKYCYDAYWGLWIHMAEIKSFRVSSTSTQWNPPMTPATFSVSDLSIQPAEVQAEETVTITASVANVGGAEGTCTVVLNINGVKEAEQAVSLGAGESQDVTFSVSREEAATYSVAVEGLTGEFVVVPPPPANYGPLYSGIVAGVIAVGLLSYYWMTRRRAY